MSGQDQGVPASPPLMQGFAPEPVPVSASGAIANAGDVFAVRYPFVRETYEAYGEDGPERRESWRPGVIYEEDGEYTYIGAGGEGFMVLTVVDTFKPGRFPRRVFYTRKFIDPDGREFGKGGLRIATVEKFRRLARGYRDPYDAGDGKQVLRQSGLAESAALFAELLALASVDTHPKGGDAFAAPFMSGAVPKADAHDGGAA